MAMSVTILLLVLSPQLTPARHGALDGYMDMARSIE
jgi:hypothetical protein